MNPHVMNPHACYEDAPPNPQREGAWELDERCTTPPYGITQSVADSLPNGKRGKIPKPLEKSQNLQILRHSSIKW